MSSRPIRHAVFVDTSAYFALADPDDQGHAEASRMLSTLKRQSRNQVTSNFVLAEFHGFAVRRRGSRIALQTLKAILAGPTIVVQVTEVDQHRSVELLEMYSDKGYSMIDCISFAVMERLDGLDRLLVRPSFRSARIQRARCGMTKRAAKRPLVSSRDLASLAQADSA